MGFANCAIFNFPTKCCSTRSSRGGSRCPSKHRNCVQEGDRLFNPNTLFCSILRLDSCLSADLHMPPTCTFLYNACTVGSHCKSHKQKNSAQLAPGISVPTKPRFFKNIEHTWHQDLMFQPIHFFVADWAHTTSGSVKRSNKNISYKWIEHVWHQGLMLPRKHTSCEKGWGHLASGFSISTKPHFLQKKWAHLASVFRDSANPLLTKCNVMSIAQLPHHTQSIQGFCKPE